MIDRNLRSAYRHLIGVDQAVFRLAAHQLVHVDLINPIQVCIPGAKRQREVARSNARAIEHLADEMIESEVIVDVFPVVVERGIRNANFPVLGHCREFTSQSQRDSRFAGHVNGDERTRH